MGLFKRDCVGSGLALIKAIVTIDEQRQACLRPVETTEGAMDEYIARQDAERAKMAKFREMRLAAKRRPA